MDSFETSAQAFQAARARASVATHVEARTLHLAVHDARESGLSVREAAAALRVPKSTIARHWREGHHCPELRPIWGNGEEYINAERAVWKHDPAMFGGRVPFVWIEGANGTRSVRPLQISEAKIVEGKRDGNA